MPKATQNSGANKRGRVENLIPHQFKPGQSGNPGGRPQTTPIADALREALGSPAKLKKFIAGVIEKAEDGDSKAFTAVADRIEGKPAQAINLDGQMQVVVHVDL